MEQTLAIILQECDNLKSRLSELRPLPADALKKIEEAFAIEYTYESNRIEGNTLTLQETELVVNEGVTIAGKSMRLFCMASIVKMPDFPTSDEPVSIEKRLYIGMPERFQR